MDEYVDRLIGPYVAAEQGLVDELIDPCETREVLIRSLVALRGKRASLPRRGRGNIPL
jgi:acetyl-CoA carboxylase carboxyltransferase component